MVFGIHVQNHKKKKIIYIKKIKLLLLIVI